MSAIDRSFIRMFSRPKPALTDREVDVTTSMPCHAQAQLQSGLSEAMASLAQRYLDALAADPQAKDGTTLRFDPPASQSAASTQNGPTWPTPASTETIPSPQSPPAAVHAVAPPSSEVRVSENSATRVFDAAHDPSVPQPHWEPSDHRQALATAVAVEPIDQPDLDSPNVERPIPDEPETVVATTVESSAVESVAIGSVAGDSSDWEPAAYEVDRLVWPDVCEKLSQTAQAGLRRTARHVLDGADTGKNVVLITGQKHSEGRTTTALCLAAELAAMNKSVVLVDGNFDHPVLANRVGVAPQCGWEDVVLNDLALSDVMIESIEDGITIVPLTAQTSTRVGPANDLHLPVILETLRTRFDVILIDSLPIDYHHESTVMLETLGPFIDSAILLHTDVDETTPGLSHALSQLLNAGIEPLGIIRNTLPNDVAA